MSLKPGDPNKRIKNPVRCRDTILTEECFGNCDPTYTNTETGVVVNVKMQVGEVQRSCYPKKISEFAEGEKRAIHTEKRNINNLKGQTKGLTQLLFERGLWDSRNPPSCQEARELLGQCPDYKYEDSVISRIA